MTSDVDRITAACKHQVAQHMRDFFDTAPGYIESYIDATLRGRSTNAHGMHPDLARFLRDVCQDEMMFERRSGYSVEHHRRAA